MRGRLSTPIPMLLLEAAQAVRHALEKAPGWEGPAGQCSVAAGALGDQLVLRGLQPQVREGVMRFRTWGTAYHRFVVVDFGGRAWVVDPTADQFPGLGARGGVEVCPLAGSVYEGRLGDG